jgi:hypothetical protein
VPVHQDFLALFFRRTIFLLQEDLLLSDLRFYAATFIAITS